MSRVTVMVGPSFRERICSSAAPMRVGVPETRKRTRYSVPSRVQHVRRRSHWRRERPRCTRNDAGRRSGASPIVPRADPLRRQSLQSTEEVAVGRTAAPSKLPQRGTAADPLLPCAVECCDGTPPIPLWLPLRGGAAGNRNLTLSLAFYRLSCGFVPTRSGSVPFVT